jgi:hypothetical protein
LATRELGDARPEFTLGGELHAIEVYDSNDLWFAHLAITLTLNRFSDGERLWSFQFDERKQVRTQSFSHAVRSISELLDLALKKSVGELERVARGERIIPAIQLPAPSEGDPKRISNPDAGTTESVPERKDKGELKNEGEREGEGERDGDGENQGEDSGPKDDTIYLPEKGVDPQ